MKPYGLRPGDGEKSRRTSDGCGVFIGNKLDVRHEDKPRGKHKASKIHAQRKLAHKQARADNRKLCRQARVEPEETPLLNAPQEPSEVELKEGLQVEVVDRTLSLAVFQEDTRRSKWEELRHRAACLRDVAMESEPGEAFQAALSAYTQAVAALQPPTPTTLQVELALWEAMTWALAHKASLPSRGIPAYQPWGNSDAEVFVRGLAQHLQNPSPTPPAEHQ